MKDKKEKMHPRNPYKIPPDYTNLAINYPNFRKVCKLGLDGKVVVDYKKQEVLKALCQTLLKENFDLDITLPENCLIPTVPLRLNYILWMEDIISNLKDESSSGHHDTHGIDIGCGSSCIYSLLGARKNNWNMLALESNDENYKFARKNIENNHLSDKITVFHQKRKIVIFEDLFKSEVARDSYDFCLCNPPFYDYKNSERQKRRNINCPHPSNAPSGTEEELSCEGGETGFVGKIIAESLIFKERIKIYSTMLGHKASLAEIMRKLKDAGIKNFTTTEFCQGKVVRWGVAWTFLSDVLPEEISPDEVKT